MSEDKPSANASATQSAMPESSMEEIIASIGRIIAEDNRTPHPARISPRENGDILELTEVIEPDGSVRRLGSGTPAGPQTVTGPLSAIPAETEPAGLEAETATRPAAEASRERLLSATASEPAAAAFARLATIAGEPREASGPMLGAAAARTLEDIVRDALRPLLQTWLDDHLPEVVERLVQEEIQRLVRDVRLR